MIGEPNPNRRPVVASPATAKLLTRYLQFLSADPAEVEKALAQVHRSPGWRRYWRTNDKRFARDEDAILGRSKRSTGPPGKFRPFRERYFGERGWNYPHFDPWIDLYENPQVRRAIIVGPPESGRTTTMNVQRYTHMAALEAHHVHSGNELEHPLRAAVISASLDLAERIGWQLSQYLTDEYFSGDLIRDYGPFKSPTTRSRWTYRELYLAWRGAEEKDPSFQFLGWDQSLQSARLTDATFDDVDNPLSSGTERKKILRFLDQIVLPRLGTTGRLWYLCNRVDSQDVAKELLERAEDGTWHAIVQRAIQRCEKWETEHDCTICGKALWPERLPLEHLEDARKQLRNDRLFALVYLAETSSEGSDFPRHVIERTYDSSRTLGQYPDTARVIVSLDPATTGGAGIVAEAYEPSTDVRYVLDCDWGTDRRTRGLHAWVREYVLKYRPCAFGIEIQGGNALFAEDEELRNFLIDHDCTIYDLPTGRNKRDPEYGVPGMISLFDAYDPKISIPWGDQATIDKMRVFVQQLTDYHPAGQASYDLVMARWFNERVIRAHLPRAVSQAKTPVDPLFARRPYLAKR